MTWTILTISSPIPYFRDATVLTIDISVLLRSANISSQQEHSTGTSIPASEHAIHNASNKSRYGPPHPPNPYQSSSQIQQDSQHAGNTHLASDPVRRAVSYQEPSSYSRHRPIQAPMPWPNARPAFFHQREGPLAPTPDPLALIQWFACHMRDGRSGSNRSGVVVHVAGSVAPCFTASFGQGVLFRFLPRR
jgi:hypothetical protein